MPRPVSWMPRLHEIRRTVNNSVRSHYDRRDLEQLFELQPRAAQKLLELLSTVQVGRSRLAEREALACFLEGLNEAEDTHGYIEQVRKKKAAVSRRKIRSLVRADIAPVTLSSLPASMTLSRGHLEISFASIEELAEAMLTLARILETEGDEFARAYGPESSAAETEDADEVRILFQELETWSPG